MSKALTEGSRLADDRARRSFVPVAGRVAIQRAGRVETSSEKLVTQRGYVIGTVDGLQENLRGAGQSERADPVVSCSYCCCEAEHFRVHKLLCQSIIDKNRQTPSGCETGPPNSLKALALPREVRRFNLIKALAKSGTLNRATVSLGFLPGMSHRNVRSHGHGGTGLGERGVRRITITMI
jgi:hypothetical protein